MILRRNVRKKGILLWLIAPIVFDMGEAAGRFSYIEDPDGTLIEFVETHKIPIFKKLGWYLHLEKEIPTNHCPTGW